MDRDPTIVYVHTVVRLDGFSFHGIPSKIDCEYVPPSPYIPFARCEGNCDKAKSSVPDPKTEKRQSQSDHGFGGRMLFLFGQSNLASHTPPKRGNIDSLSFPRFLTTSSCLIASTCRRVSVRKRLRVFATSMETVCFCLSPSTSLDPGY